MRQCAGYSDPMGQGRLEQCPYDAGLSSRYCFFHQQVVDGHIQASWKPSAPVDTEEEDPFERLLREWS